MDLGIRGKTAIVCASSKGLGRGSAQALAEAGVNLVLNARGEEALTATADAIRAACQVQVVTVPGDVTTDAIQAELVGQANEMAGGAVDILVNNAGGPPPGMWSDWDRADWEKALNGNMLTPIALIKAVLPGMIEKKWGRIVNITSGSVRSPIPILGLSNAARAGLTGYVAGTSRQVAQYGVVMNNLLPGAHDTDRIAALAASESKATGKSVDEVKAGRAEALPTKAIGTPEDFGQTCAFMCSDYVKFMIGQNILLDGGAFNSTT
ncbi:3-oxoacyl-[acyl-carrier protein] reductase [Albimonas donghaensis]|uniref:3-oxoacyl-[acyl-carrier protein] reductase n=1 Tax=Albimonas donghaensis TaxID=356660 RepID=A0A1H2T268_9RHOB|nr:SDR family oxidoreductase [Albimonas donghaensis]SDW38043.1 3-oxoacyl-[acyl-carrier protein] reductase [Albimonas donghaensis]